MNPGTLLPQLRAQGLAPRKGLGQHYLTDANILAAIVAAAELPPDAVVIEVGPGPGTLTSALLPHVGRLIAIELDDHLAPMLAEHFRDWPAFHLLHADALAITPAQALDETGGPTPPSRQSLSFPCRASESARQPGSRGAPTIRQSPEPWPRP